jgi:transcriptional regulator with XRE-family HTH domain
MKIVCAHGNDTLCAVCNNATVPSEERNYLREWRLFKGLTLEELADKVGTNKSVIHLLENEKRPLSAKWLRKLADALGTTPGRILDVNPNETSAEVLDIWDHIAAADRPRAVRILKSLTGTDD